MSPKNLAHPIGYPNFAVGNNQKFCIMRNVILTFATLCLGVLLLQSCNRAEDDEWRVMVDTVPTPVCFVVKDAEGNNLLDDNFEGNILGSEITLSVNHAEPIGIVMTEVEPDASVPGLYIGSVKVDGVETPCLEYWFIHHNEEGERQHFCLYWGDGSSDVVEVSYYFTARNQGSVVVCHQKVWLNGELNAEGSLTATIVK